MTAQDMEAAQGLLIRRARENFVAFLHVLWPQVPGQKYRLSRVHHYVAGLINDTLHAKGMSRHGLSLPPQHGKSQLVSVRAVAWALGAFPGIKIALTSYSHSLLVDRMNDVAEVIDLPVYRAIFPNVRVKERRNRQTQKGYANGSTLDARTTGGQLVGFGADLLIIDDPHANREQAESITYRNKIQRWYFSSALTRLSPDAKQFIVATRWHPQDLVGMLTSEEYVERLKAEGHEGQKFEIVNLPAIAEEEDVLGRQPGEALFPEVRDLNFLLAAKATIDSYEWASQYQGDPRPAGAGQVDISKIGKIDEDELPEGLEIVTGWDLALTIKRRSDYTAGARIGWHAESKTMYVLEVIAKKQVWERTKSEIKALALADKEKWGQLRIGVEGVSGFSIGYEELFKDLAGEVHVERRNPKNGMDKLMRARPWLNLVDAGRLVLVKGKWNRDFLDELSLFPEGAHDDQVDAVSIGAEMVMQRAQCLIA